MKTISYATLFLSLITLLPLCASAESAFSPLTATVTFYQQECYKSTGLAGGARPRVAKVIKFSTFLPTANSPLNELTSFGSNAFWFNDGFEDVVGRTNQMAVDLPPGHAFCPPGYTGRILEQLIGQKGNLVGYFLACNDWTQSVPPYLYFLAGDWANLAVSRYNLASCS